MRTSKIFSLRFFIVVTALVILMGCGSRVSKTDTDNKAQQNKTVGHDVQPSLVEDGIRQSNFIEGIKEIPFKVTPLLFEVHSKNEPVIVTINDTLEPEKLGMQDDLLDYSIYLYVHPLDIGYWYRQNPASPQEKWTSQANLSLYWVNEAGGFLSRRTVRNGWGFEIIAVLIKQSLSKTLPEIVFNLEDLIKVKGVHVVSEIRTAIVKR